MGKTATTGIPVGCSKKVIDNVCQTPEQVTQEDLMKPEPPD